MSFKIKSDIEQTILPEQLEDRLLMSELILKLTLCSNPNISVSSWQKSKIKDSFEILRMSRFQNWPSFLNLVKIWGSYGQKTNCILFLWTPCSTVLYNTLQHVLSLLVDTHLLEKWIKPLMLGRLDKKLSGRWWHCNNSL